jgi:Cobalamin biosynthesis protein CobT (nicotinate-mononucleotide:5, 6-dimethylbenzimidazole phosphoribosyltransferase)
MILITSLISLGCISLSNNQSNTTSCNASNQVEEIVDDFEHEWDDFMLKSMNPNEDDEDEEEEEEDEGDGHCDHDDSVEDDAEGNQDNQINDEKSSEKEDTPDSESDPYDDLPEEDEPTTCTICLINRQGPCRPTWRKFEKCMKDNSSAEAEGKDKMNQNEGSSLGEKCDKYMLPWITCLQKFRNRYTLISNNFFQNEMIAEIENGIDEEEKILLDNFDVKSIVQIGNDWSKADPLQEISDDDDVPLVEGVVSINLWDANQSRPIEIAFVKDQDGTLLGYEQFFDFKKQLNGKVTEDLDDNIGKVGGCIFHANPATTKSIQIFALYRNRETTDESDANSNDDAVVHDHASDIDSNRKSQDESKETRPVGGKQALFYSKLLTMEEIPIQGQHSVMEQVSGEERDDQGNIIDEKNMESEKES